MQLTQFSSDIDGGILDGPVGDFYAKVTINGVMQTTEDDRYDYGFELGTGFFFPFTLRPFIDKPGWVIDADVSGVDPVIVAVEIWDQDDTSGDDQADLSPGAGRTLNLVVDPATGLWSGDAVSPVQCAQGTGGDAVRICWAISALSDDGDIDEDGLLDSWEINGLDYDGDGFIEVNLPAYGADPLHKDLFLQLNWVPTHAPSRDAIFQVKRAFAAAPLDAGGNDNPDGLPGINLWIDTGAATDASGTLIGDDLGGGGEIDTPPSGPICDLDGALYEAKTANFDTARQYIFRYMVLADDMLCDVDYGGRGELGGNDSFVLNEMFEGASIMHEFGHNLNLDHGGFQAHNCKPNYISVMNYDHASGIPQYGGSNFLVDYSPPRSGGGVRGRIPLPRLNEDGGLIDSLIMDPGDFFNRYIFRDANGDLVQRQANNPADWDSDPTTSLVGFTANIDTVDLDGDRSDDCLNYDLELLEGSDDWSAISLPFRQFGDSRDAPVNLAHPGVNDPTDSDLIALRRAINSTDLSVAKSADPETASVNEDFHYVIEVNNHGPNPASRVQVVDRLPAVLDYRSDTAGCVEAPVGTLTCDLGEILATDSRQIEITVGTRRVCEGGRSADVTNTVNVSNIVELAGEDRHPENNTGTLVTSVVDVTPPELVVHIDPNSLWPPNHKLVDITADIIAVDDCDPAPRIRLVSIESNEPNNGIGDGNTSDDIRDAAFGTDDRAFRLRAERAGAGAGREYRVIYEASDASGNATLSETVVTVSR